jgi:hypothetical protein
MKLLLDLHRGAERNPNKKGAVRKPRLFLVWCLQPYSMRPEAWASIV